MDALVMCGGRGTRLDADREKPLVRVGDRPMVDRVVDALRACRVDRVVAVTSPATPDTRAHLDCPTVEAAGEGYVADLADARERHGTDGPVLTAVADLPLLTGDVVDDVLAAWGGGSATVAVPASRVRDLGCRVDRTFDHDGRRLVPAGLNVVAEPTHAEADEGDTVLIRRDRPLAVNVNRPRDLRVARALARK